MNKPSAKKPAPKIRAPKTSTFGIRVSDTERGMLETIAIISESDVSALFRGMIPDLYEGVSGPTFDLLRLAILQAYSSGLRQFALRHLPEGRGKRPVEVVRLDLEVPARGARAAQVEEQVTRLAQALVGAVISIRDEHKRRQQFVLGCRRPTTARAGVWKRAVPFTA